MARAGQAVELEPRTVRIDQITILSWDDATADEPVAVIDVACSAGTYVRSLARDLGAAVGSAAYLGALVRTASGPFRLEEAITLDDVRAAAEAGPDELGKRLLPIDAGLDLPTVTIPAAGLSAVVRGQAVGVPPGTGALDADVPVRLVDESGQLVAIARLAGTKLAPDKVLVDSAAAGG
jgi:tRNA pseudouridine55 synthase